MKNNFRIASILLVLQWGVIGCGSCNRPPIRVTTIFKPITTTPRILVQSEPKGVTGVYQQGLRVLPVLVLDGKNADPGEHEFTLNSSYSYTGKKPTCNAKSLVLDISHAVRSDDSWKFPSSALATVVIDGSPYVLKVYSQLPYELPAMAKYMNNPEASEALIISPSCELYQRISKASTMEFRIGNGSFALPPEGVSNFRDFAEAIGFQ